VRQLRALGVLYRKKTIVKKLILLLSMSLMMMLVVATAALAMAQTVPGDEDEVLCFLPEGCDTNGDSVPDLRAGEPASGDQVRSGVVQYNNAL
jgi:hypothetical protein